MEIERRRKTNKNFQEDIEKDLETMLQYFLTHPSAKRLRNIPHVFDLIQVAQTTHFKKKQYLLEFFWKLTQETYESARGCSEKFALCLMILHFVFFHQSQFYVLIPIHAEKLEVINRSLHVLLAECGADKRDIWLFATTCLNQLKTYNAFTVTYDIFSMCLDEQSTKDFEIEIKKCDTELKKAKDMLDENFYYEND